jgi:hypothetical protein
MFVDRVPTYFCKNKALCTVISNSLHEPKLPPTFGTYQRLT